jgi:hypothetical protein
MYIQTRDMNVAKDKNWVLYGSGGTLDSMPRRLDIQYYLRKAARRMRRQVSSHRQIYSEY